MVKLILASLALCSTASARVAPLPRPVFTADTKLKADVDLPTSHFELFANGAWSFHREQGGKVHEESGTLSRAQVRRIERLLSGATWTTTHPKFHCMAYSAQYTAYSVHGRHVWTQEMCGSESLDARSLTSLNAVLAIVGPLES